MTIYYSKNDVLLRDVQAGDLAALARTLRPKDRAELLASGLTPSKATLAGFVRQSAWSAVLVNKSGPLAVCGFAPQTFLSARAQVWMLSAAGVEKCPKTFFKISKAVIAYGLTRYTELYNFTDERYTRALEYVRRLGGSFDGTDIYFGPRRFLCFTFRRKSWEAL